MSHATLIALGNFPFLEGRLSESYMMECKLCCRSLVGMTRQVIKPKRGHECPSLVAESREVLSSVPIIILLVASEVPRCLGCCHARDYTNPALVFIEIKHGVHTNTMGGYSRKNKPPETIL